MQQDVTINEGPESAEVSGGCCGGGCCGGEASTTPSDAVAAQFEVEGMTCDHCANAVTQELSSIAGVQDVQVSVVSGGRSTVAVSSATPLDREAVRAAIDEAGYTLVD